MEIRALTPDGMDAATETIALAFRTDPVWGPALLAGDGSHDHLDPYWRIYVAAAQRQDSVFVSHDGGTVSVWIPPGGTELSAEDESALRALAEDALEPARATALFELWGRFDENHPDTEPFAYLSLLATHPSLAGHGYGQANLAAALERWDAVGTPTYLESTNPGNDHRYERQGYRRIGRFESVLDGAVVSTMWRPVGG